MNISVLGSTRATYVEPEWPGGSSQQAVVAVRSGESGSGTGIIWGGAGLVVTNAHCIRRGASVQVMTPAASGAKHPPLAYHPSS